jgi:hypothetical protein
MKDMEQIEELLQALTKNFINDLSVSVKPFSQEESITYIGILIDYLKGVFNHEPAMPEYDYDGNPFDEDEFIEKNLLEPFREKMIPFVKTSLKYYFATDAAKELDKIVKVMQENPTMTIELGSHTDCRSSKAYNLSLSSKRAKSSAEYIVSKGIAKNRIVGKGYGESKLINGCECEGKVQSSCSEDEHQANRRTEFLITKF